jgi:hypothetical protein
MTKAIVSVTLAAVALGLCFWLVACQAKTPTAKPLVREFSGKIDDLVVVWAEIKTSGATPQSVGQRLDILRQSSLEKVPSDEEEIEDTINKDLSFKVDVEYFKVVPLAPEGKFTISRDYAPPRTQMTGKGPVKIPNCSGVFWVKLDGTKQLSFEGTRECRLVYERLGESKSEGVNKLKQVEVNRTIVQSTLKTTEGVTHTLVWLVPQRS